MYHCYRFNGKENDNEVKGEGNQINYGMRIDDPRIGRFLSVDPLTKGYPMLTPYQYASRIYDPRIGKFLSVDPLAMEYSDQSSYAYAANSPIRLIDVFGRGTGDPPGVGDKAR